MKNNKERGHWRPELNVNMDYPVCSFIKICLVKYIIPNCSKLSNLIVFSLSVRDNNKELIGAGTTYATTCTS